MAIVVVGSKGQLGSELCRKLGGDAIGLGRQDIDLLNPASVSKTICDLAPCAVINAAAYTAVDQAEDEPAICEAMNARAVAYLADACREAHCPLVQISTDYVFGSASPRDLPYRETDPVEPRSVYAKSKFQGEQNAAAWKKHFVVRTCGLYGQINSKSSRNFVETMLRLAANRPLLRVVDDQHCTPSYVPHVANALLFLLSTDAYGVYHVVNTGATTWYDFAREIFRRSNINTRVEPITTAEFGARATRPSYSVLDCEKYRTLGGPSLPDWQDALAEYLTARAGGFSDR